MVGVVERDPPWNAEKTGDAAIAGAQRIGGRNLPMNRN